MYRTAADALRFNAIDIAQEVPKKASRILCAEGHSLRFSMRKGNRIVTVNVIAGVAVGVGVGVTSGDSGTVSLTPRPRLAKAERLSSIRC